MPIAQPPSSSSPAEDRSGVAPPAPELLDVELPPASPPLEDPPPPLDELDEEDDDEDDDAPPSPLDVPASPPLVPPTTSIVTFVFATASPPVLPV